MHAGNQPTDCADEANYYDFGTQTISFASVTGSSQLSDIRERDNVVKMGVNWKFGW